MKSRAPCGFSMRRRYQSGSLGVGVSFIVAPFHQIDNSLQPGTDVHENHADSVKHLEHFVKLPLLAPSSDHAGTVASIAAARQMAGPVVANEDEEGASRRPPPATIKT